MILIWFPCETYGFGDLEPQNFESDEWFGTLPSLGINGQLELIGQSYIQYRTLADWMVHGSRAFIKLDIMTLIAIFWICRICPKIKMTKCQENVLLITLCNYCPETVLVNWVTVWIIWRRETPFQGLLIYVRFCVGLLVFCSGRRQNRTGSLCSRELY